VTSGLNLELLFRCRLIVGRYGEMDISRWWNTSGVLSELGSKVAARGLPRTEFYSRARVLFAVASYRTREYFCPPGSFSIWLMPPSVEQALDETMIRWVHEGRSWPEILVLLDSLKKDGLTQTLQNAGVLTDATLNTVSNLKPGPEGKSIRVPDVISLADETVRVLAAAFVHSKSGALLVPMVSVTGGAGL
jgi:hypothetical protein